MKDHALIVKFIGFWPIEKVMQGWIAAKWKPKGHITLQLGPKRFFTAVFNCLENRNRIIDGGLHFFNDVGLYLRYWVEIFNPDKEDLSWAPVWIRLYSLPLEYWDEASLQDIGNGLGEFVKVSKETKLRRYTSYAHICVYMHLNNALPDAVSLFHDDFEWIQSIDHEHVPFCYADGFTKVSHCRKNLRKSRSNPKTSTDNLPRLSTWNNFEFLAQPDMDNLESLALPKEQPKSKAHSASTSIEIPQKSKQTADLSSPSPSDILAWITQSMEVDNEHTTLKDTKGNIEEINETQNMEEEPEIIDIGDLDILGLE
eukprot:PITA_03441